jgi:hypothetical protein
VLRRKDDPGGHSELAQDIEQPSALPIDGRVVGQNGASGVLQPLFRVLEVRPGQALDTPHFAMRRRS